KTGVHFLSSQGAAECGYTVALNQHGDLLFHASYLACYVENWVSVKWHFPVVSHEEVKWLDLQSQLYADIP
ncbi:hypothetical protein QTP86_029261, partial [Hemibagrus guttatus]